MEIVTDSEGQAIAVVFVAPSDLGWAMQVAQRAGAQLGPDEVAANVEYVRAVSAQCNTGPYNHVWYYRQLVR